MTATLRQTLGLALMLDAVSGTTFVESTDTHFTQQVAITRFAIASEPKLD